MTVIAVRSFVESPVDRVVPRLEAPGNLFAAE